MPPPGLDLKEGMLPVAPLGRMDATSNRSNSPGIDCALRIPVSRPKVKTRKPNNILALQLAHALGTGVVITDSLRNFPGPSYHLYLSHRSRESRPGQWNSSRQRQHSSVKHAWCDARLSAL